jgi:PhzF family phenazine biosynthesis protein
MELRFKQVDVFTSRPFRGNPVAVVIGADGIDGAEMQHIARWTNLSETTFLLPSSRGDYKVRIFSPSQELPFAGHPTIGTAHAALESGFVQKKKKLVQDCGAGLIELSVEDDGRIFLQAPPSKIARVDGPIPSVAVIPGSPLLKVDVGPTWVVGELPDAKALAALAPDMTALGSWADAQRATGVTVFARSGDSSSAIHVRSFAPSHGIAEDPVCGSGNISVATYLRENDQLKRFGSSYVARQGMQLGRDGRVEVRVGKTIEIGGHAVTCVEGTLRAS